LGQIEEPDRKLLLHVAQKLEAHQHHGADSAGEQKASVKKSSSGGRPPKHLSVGAQP
jgi:hypothetical protein